MREIRVHAASGDEARVDGAAALGVEPAEAEVEILDSDEHGVTARVWVPEDGPTDEPAPAPAPPPRRERTAEDDDEARPASVARDYLDEMLELIGLEASVEIAEESEDEVLLNVEGDDLGTIIGNFGQTLNAVQFLVNLMVNRRGRRQRIIVDAGGYRDRRREKLEEIAHEHAKRAKEERRGVILEGLRAAERRIIHTALQNDPDVVTFSEGDEPHRRLIISPRHQ